MNRTLAALLGLVIGFTIGQFVAVLLVATGLAPGDGFTVIKALPIAGAALGVGVGIAIARRHDPG